MNRMMIDLFAGLGGGSTAFLSNDWPNYQVESNVDLLDHNDGINIVADVDEHRDLIIKHFKQRMDWFVKNGGLSTVVLWASPPCYEFSTAYSAPGPTARRQGIDFMPDMTLLMATMQIIEELEIHAEQLGARFVWVVENVRGAIKHFKPEIGKPRAIVGPFVLWGNFPRLAFMDRAVFKHTKAKADKRWSKIRSNVRAKVPAEISQAIYDSAVRQQRLELN